MVIVVMIVLVVAVMIVVMAIVVMVAHTPAHIVVIFSFRTVRKGRVVRDMSASFDFTVIGD